MDLVRSISDSFVVSFQGDLDESMWHAMRQGVEEGLGLGSPRQQPQAIVTGLGMIQAPGVDYLREGQRYARMEPLRLILEGTYWLENAPQLADALRATLPRLPLAVQATGINPHFLVHCEWAPTAAEVTHPGHPLGQLLGDDGCLQALRATRPMDGGTLGIEMSFPQPVASGVVVRFNWHVQHDNASEAAERCARYPEHVEGLRSLAQDLAGAPGGDSA